MKQALHILRKDILYLWREICLVLAITAMLAWAETATLTGGLAEILWMLAAAFTIARAVHAEAIPGQNQFWITRPYRWTSLLAAKVLFVLLFINLPLLLAQVYIVHSAQFPLLSNLPGLLWSQALIILCFSLPISALATMTAGAVSFLFCAFTLLTLGYIALSGNLNRAETPISVEWVRLSFVICAVVTLTSIAIYLLYRTRRTGMVRIWAAAGAAIAVALYFYTPWSLALAVQSRLSRQAFDASSLNVALDPEHRVSAPPDSGMRGTNVAAILPIRIASAGPDSELQADAVTVVLTGKDGKIWNSGFAGVNQSVIDDRNTLLNVLLSVDRDFFQEEGARTVTAQVTLYLTLFGDPKQRTIPVQGRAVDALNGLRCGNGLLDQLYCRSAFRWPGSRVYAKFGMSGPEAFTPSISYSPFPANLDFNPIERHWVSTPRYAKEATLISKQPLSHFRRDMEFQALRLKDFTGRISYRPFTGNKQ